MERFSVTRQYKQEYNVYDTDINGESNYIKYENWQNKGVSLASVEVTVSMWWNVSLARVN